MQYMPQHTRTQFQCLNKLAAARKHPETSPRVPRRRAHEELPVLGRQHRQDGGTRRPVRRPDALDLLAVPFPDGVEEDVPSRR